MLFHGEPIKLPENRSNMIVFLWPTNNTTGKTLNSLKWSLAMLDYEVLLQTEEQWISLLKTNALIIRIKLNKVWLSKQCFTRFIWPIRDIQEAGQLQCYDRQKLNLYPV